MSGLALTVQFLPLLLCSLPLPMLTYPHPSPGTCPPFTTPSFFLAIFAPGVHRIGPGLAVAFRLSSGLTWVCTAGQEGRAQAGGSSF